MNPAEYHRLYMAKKGSRFNRKLSKAVKQGYVFVRDNRSGAVFKIEERENRVSIGATRLAVIVINESAKTYFELPLEEYGKNWSADEGELVEYEP